MKKDVLTEKQQAILKYICSYLEIKGYPPSIREIAEEFNITPKGAYDHLKALEKKGFIKTEKNKSRAIEILENGKDIFFHDLIRIPIVGNISAGKPIFAQENIEDYITLPISMISSYKLKDKEIFALRVNGDSMKDANINDGDIAIIRKTNIANNGEIVVALIEDEATLKYFYKDNKNIRLEPANSKYKPIITKNAIVIGKLIGLYKKF
ncbi:MAG: transcriptional repressor LexA [Leptonema sp. (in: bacteria)]